MRRRSGDVSIERDTPVSEGLIDVTTLLREMFRAPADLEIDGDEFHVTVHPLSATRWTRAMTALCAELTTTKTIYPGTDLTLVFAASSMWAPLLIRQRESVMRHCNSAPTSPGASTP